MRHASRLLLSVGCTMLVVLTGAAAAEPGPTAVRLLGPLPLPPAAPAAGALVPAMAPVPEFDPATADPFTDSAVVLDPSGPLTWARAAATGGAVPLPSPGVWWAAARLQLPRFARVTVTLAGPRILALWVDGAAVGLGGAGGPRTATVPLARGVHSVLVRARRDREGDGALGLTAAAEPAAQLRWSLDRRVAPTSYDELVRALPRIGAVAVATGGELVARALKRWPARGDGELVTTDVLDPAGTVVASTVGGPGVEPVGFLPGRHSLVLRRDLDAHGTALTDLLLYDVDARQLTTILTREPDLGLVRVGPGGSHLLLLSSRGAGSLTRSTDAPRRQGGLRERMTDWLPRRHLWLVEVASGARRRLTAPGDWVVDDAAFVPARQAVVYARTVPQPQRPWFATELHLLDLKGGADHVVATFSGGWENHPHALAPDPRGHLLAFVGPPAQVDPGGPDHNLYQGTVWLLGLDDGSFAPLTGDAAPAFGEAGGLLVWERTGQAILATAVDSARGRLERLSRDPSGAWGVAPMDPGTVDLAAAAAASDARAVATVVSSRTEPPELRLWTFGEEGGETVVERPGADLAERFALTAPREASFDGPGGELLEGWYYPPTDPAPDAKVPLVVHYYGGATPTRRDFDPFHQVLAADGYGVLVVNPRGAIGRGQAFADEHVRDWGPKAAADVLAGVDALLAGHPEIDPQRIGLYGGSYGGFLTEYLLTVTPRFAAAVALYGISDLASYWGAGAWGFTYGDTALAGAFPWSDQELFAGRSPLYRADRITTPLLLVHGTADVNVPPDESQQLYTALRTQGKTAELVLVPGGEHMLWDPLSRRVGHLDLIVRWLDRFLRSEPEGWEARWENP